MIAKIQDIKAAPAAGKQRLVVRERGKNLTHAVIDIDMKVAKELKAKETYFFQVSEKDDSRNPGFQRKRSATFRAYSCDEKPETYSSQTETRRRMDRFGGNGNTTQASRIRF